MMSASLVLPRASPAYYSSDSSKSPDLVLSNSNAHRGLPSFTNCPVGSKTALLKSRRHSPQAVIVPATHKKKNSLPSPIQESVTLARCGLSEGVLSSPKPLPESIKAEKSQIDFNSPNLYFSRDIRRPSTDTKQKLLSPLSSDIPFFSFKQRSSVSPDSQQSSNCQPKTPLIMPNFFSFFKSDSAQKSPLPRNTSSRSLNDPSSPSPLIRKCNTMVTLSEETKSRPQTTSTKHPKDRKSRLNFLRNISSSSSSSGLKQSPSTPHSFQWCKRNSGIWPQEPGTILESSETTASSTRSMVKCSSSNASVAPSKKVGVSPESAYCKLCLSDVPSTETVRLEKCHCRFCAYCLCQYTTLKIREGECTVECPDSKCKSKGEITLDEIDELVGLELKNLHLRYRSLKDVDLDPYKTWCPKAGCECVVSLTISKFDGRPCCSVCPTCATVFCASCANPWHPGKRCLKANAHPEVPLNDAIKRCPVCKVPIERDAGCAQMQCKKCKHVFCWYCLASLEDDFLLRHYDKGPCKNKLGHSRASVLWHRAQVVVIFAGFGLLLVFASPLLLLVGPCLLCRGCRQCPNDADSTSSSADRSDSSSRGSSRGSLNFEF